MNTSPNLAGGGVSSGVDAEAIEVLIRSLVGPDCPSIEYEGPERRLHRRYVKPLPVAATPVDVNNYAIGARFDTIARDISAGGVCLLHNEPVDAKRLAIDIGSPQGLQVRLLLEVLRCRRVEEGYYEIAGRFKNW